MADTSLVFNLVARDQASGTFDKMRGKMKLVGIAAGAMALKFGKDSVDAFVEAQASQDRLQFSLAKFPKLADTNVDRLGKLNSKLALKTKFDDDATASGQAVLAQFVDTGKQLESLTPLLQDYAAKTGKDLPTAAASMGKAFLGNTRALKELGINYVATGDKTQDMANITELMRAKVGGFAEKEGKSAAGQAAILKNQFGEIQETVGSKLVPILTTLAGKLLEVIGFVQRNSSVIGPLVVILGGFAAAVWAVNKASSAAKSVQSAFNAVLGRTAVEATAAGTSTSKTGKILGSGGVWGLAITAGVLALGTFAVKHAQAKARIDEMAGSLDKATGAITAETRATTVNNLEKAGALEAARKLGINLRDVTSAALGNADAQRRVNAVLADYRATLPDATGKTGAHTGANVQLSAAQRETAGAAARVASAISGASAEMVAAREKANRLRDALNAIPSNVPVNIHYTVDGNPGRYEGKALPRAAGGPVSAGMPYWVGERGPELMVPSTSGQIMPHGAGGGTTVIVNVAGSVTSERNLALALRDHLDDMARRRGGATLAPAR